MLMIEHVMLYKCLTYSVIHSLTHSLVNSLALSFTHLFSHSLTHSFTHSHTDSLFNSFTHQLWRGDPRQPQTVSRKGGRARWTWGREWWLGRGGTSLLLRRFCCPWPMNRLTLNTLTHIWKGIQAISHSLYNALSNQLPWLKTPVQLL